jgi:hypothetical protein
MSEATLKTAIFNWLQTVIAALWVGVGNARPANKIAFVWHMDQNARPATPLLEARLSNDLRIGRDVAKQNSNGSQSYTGDREEMIYFTAMGPGAMDTLKTIRNAVEDETLRPTMAANSFTVVEAHQIIDAHTYLDSMPEDRGTIDLRIRFVDTWSTVAGKPGIIETANITETVH